MAGIAVTRSQVEEMAGTTARAARSIRQRIGDFKEWLDAQPDATLQATPYAFTAGEVADLRSAYGELNRWAGNLDITFPRRLWGLGVTNTTTTA